MTISIRQQSSPISRVSASVTSVSCTLPTPPVAGNRLVWMQTVDKNAGTFSPPSGFMLRQQRPGGSVALMVAEKVSDGSESGALSASWSNAFRPKAILFELQASGGASIIYDGSNSQQTEAAGTSYSTATATSGAQSPFALVMWCNDSAKADPGDPDPTGSWTGGFTTVAEDWYASAGVGEPGFVVGAASVAVESSISSTYSHDGNSDQMAAAIIIFSETGGGPGSSGNGALLSSHRNKLVIA